MLLWILPLMAVMLFGAIKNNKILHGLSVFTSAILVVSGLIITLKVIAEGSYEFNLFYVDSISIIILDIVLIIGFLACVYSVGYLEEEIKHEKILPGRLRLYYILLHTFLFTMILALSVKNMGIMWIAIEATTLASTFLVGFYNDKPAIEAAWKYIIICSVGIAIAFLGIIFLHLSSAGTIDSTQILDWTVLYGKAGSLKSPILRLAFIFIFIGFGTKAGLAPMHTWLPDAHSQAPSPISAMLSGVLLNSAMYAIIRTLAIVNKNLGTSEFTGNIMIAAGLLSIAFAAVFIITQKDYKTLLAYSSIEHMGIIAFGLGLFTPLSVFGALFHMINHSLTKSMLFLSAGNILQKYGTREIAKINDLLKTLPVTGGAFLLGLFAIAGTPPFGVFASEINVIISVFEKGQIIIGMIFILLLAIIFAGIGVTLFSIFYKNSSVETPPPRGEGNIYGSAVILLLVGVISITGLYMPVSIFTLLNNARNIIIGG